MTNNQLLMIGIAHLAKDIYDCRKRLDKTTDEDMKAYLKDIINGCKYTQSQIAKIMMEAEDESNNLD